MLEEVMNELRNWFFVKGESRVGAWKIENGALDLPFVAVGQYFKISGSVFNDGVHQYPETLVDEEFTGEISPMAVPAAFLRLVNDIEAWQDKYGAVAASPYQSESFNGYSYSKSSGSMSGGALEWKSAFKSRLKAWRKL